LVGAGSLLARSSQRFIRQIDLDDFAACFIYFRQSRQDAILKLGLHLVILNYRQAITLELAIAELGAK